MKKWEWKEVAILLLITLTILFGYHYFIKTKETSHTLYEIKEIRNYEVEKLNNNIKKNEELKNNKLLIINKEKNEIDKINQEILQIHSSDTASLHSTIKLWESLSTDTI